MLSSLLRAHVVQTECHHHWAESLSYYTFSCSMTEWHTGSNMWQSAWCKFAIITTDVSAGPTGLTRHVSYCPPFSLSSSSLTSPNCQIFPRCELKCCSRTGVHSVHCCVSLTDSLETFHLNFLRRPKKYEVMLSLPLKNPSFQLVGSNF